MKLRPQCHGVFLGCLGTLQRLLDLHQVPNPRRQQLLWKVRSGQTLGKPPHVGTEKSHALVSPLLSTGTGETSLPGQPCAHAKTQVLSWRRKEGFALGKADRAALYDAVGLR